MRLLLSFKVLLRTPFKTLLIFFLLAVVSFAFFSRVAEYSITNREMEKAAKAYYGIGSAEISAARVIFPESDFYIYTDPRSLQGITQKQRQKLSFAFSGEYTDLEHFRYTSLSNDQIESIRRLPYISTCDKRFMTSGVSDVYCRLDEGMYFNYTARFILEGTLSIVGYGTDSQSSECSKLFFTDCTLLAGNPSWMSSRGEILISACSQLAGGIMPFFRFITNSFYEYKYDKKYCENLIIGQRYIVVGRTEQLAKPIIYVIGDGFTDSWWPAIQSIKGQPENYLETDKFAPLRELIEITNTDLHTFDVVYTEDMSSIMRFVTGDMVVKSGRALTREDSIDGADVCAVNDEFASQNGLDIGDRITLKLGKELFEQYKGLGAVAAMRERYSPPVKTVELEIVGIYMDTDTERVRLKKPNWNYSINTIFVPRSLLPLNETELTDHMFSPAEFSFTVDNAWDIPKFIEKATPAFKDMGMTLIFDDGGWLDIMENFELSTRLSVIAILAISGAVFVAIGFIVYLFIGRKKKEYAIMRALGTPRKNAIRTLILPLMTMSVLAVIIGSTAGWIYTTDNVAKNAAFTTLKDYAVDTSIPVATAAGCILGEIALVFCFTLYGLWRIGMIPPLALLQDNPNKRAKDRKATGTKPVRTEARAYASVALPAVPLPSMPYEDKDTSVIVVPSMTGRVGPVRVCRHVLRYVTKHMTRSVMKSLLAILLSALLAGAVGQFAIMRQSYINLFRSIKVEAKFLNGLPLIYEKKIEATGYVKDPYYEYTHSVDVNGTVADWVITNDISRYTEEEAEITYAGGYDGSCMQELNEVCIIGQKLLEENGLKLCDRVHVTQNGSLIKLQLSYVDKYMKEHPEDSKSFEEIIQFYDDEITKKYEDQGSYYTIAGSVTTPSGDNDRMVFSPGTEDTFPIFGLRAGLDLVEFTLADNTIADEFRKYAEQMTGTGGSRSISNQLTFLMDTSRIDDLKNTLSLLAILFPAVVAAGIIIGGVLAGLIIIQSSKEAATLRVLGTTRRRTCVILTIEQVFLCVIGLAVGVGGLLLYNGAVLVEIADKLYLFAALYFAGCLASTVICSLVATHGNGLKLLQVKE